jgi:hypothetical protein
MPLLMVFLGRRAVNGGMKRLAATDVVAEASQ